MYDRLTGTLAERQPTRAVLLVGGVGFELTVPLSSFDLLPPRGSEATLFTHLYVREDALKLFGFASDDERRFFRRLIEVQGIGPAVALSILSSTSYGDFCEAILAEDLARLTGLKGVGRKLAQRMVLDLKDGIQKERLGSGIPGGAASGPASGSVREDAVRALVTLGYAQAAATREVDRILTDGGPDMGLDELVRRALSRAR